MVVAVQAWHIRIVLHCSMRETAIPGVLKGVEGSMPLASGVRLAWMGEAGGGGIEEVCGCPRKYLRPAAAFSMKPA